MLKGNIDRKTYERYHYTLRTKYGKANKCVSDTCEGESKRFEWALKLDREYSDNPKDYLQLCKVCHSKYDKVGIGRIITEETKLKMSKAKKGLEPPNKGNDSRVSKTCIYCSKEYKSYKAKNKLYCSNYCRFNSMKGQPTRNKYGNNGR